MSVWKKKQKAHEDEYFERLERERLRNLASQNKPAPTGGDKKENLPSDEGKLSEKKD